MLIRRHLLALAFLLPTAAGGYLAVLEQNGAMVAKRLTLVR